MAIALKVITQKVFKKSCFHEEKAGLHEKKLAFSVLFINEGFVRIKVKFVFKFQHVTSLYMYIFFLLDKTVQRSVNS